MVILLLGKLDSLREHIENQLPARLHSSAAFEAYPLHVTQPLDDEVQRALVVAHPTEEEHHLWHEVASIANLVGLRWE